MDFSFGKQYKLCKKKDIAYLMEQKKTIKSFPFICHIAQLNLETDTSFQVLVSVPKRNFKKAHDRNRMKRLMRESLRLNKHELESSLEKKGIQIGMFIIFTSRELMEFSLVEKKIKKLVKQITHEIN